MATPSSQLAGQLRDGTPGNGSNGTYPPAVVFLEPIGESHEVPYVSRSVEAVFGCSQQAWLESNWWQEHLHPDDREVVLAARQRLLVKGSSPRMEYRMSAADGRLLWVKENALLVRSGGRPWMLQGVLEDVTPRRLAEQHLVFKVSRDHLTGLPTQVMFEDHLDRALARAVRARLAVAVLAIDVDDFRLTNERFGHEVGDELLRVVARRLADAIRETDVLARPGTDEFLVLLADLEPGPAGWPDATEDRPDPATEAVDRVASRIYEAMFSPIVLGSLSVQASVSIGHSIYPIDASSAHTLMAKAAAAVYRAKKGTTL